MKQKIKILDQRNTRKDLAHLPLSLSHPELVNLFSNSSPVGPESVSFGNHQIALVLCSKGHEWPCPIANLVSKVTSGTRCPTCARAATQSRGEKELGVFIKELGYSIVENDRKIPSGLEIDIYIPEIKVGIEYCGEYWHSLESVKINAKRKELISKKLGIYLIIIWKRDWKNNTDQIKEELTNSLTLKQKGIQK